MLNHTYLDLFQSASNGSVSTRDLVYFNHKCMDLFQSISNGSISICFQWICFNPTKTKYIWICFNPLPMDLFQSDKDKIYIWICFNLTLNGSKSYPLSCGSLSTLTRNNSNSYLIRGSLSTLTRNNSKFIFNPWSLSTLTRNNLASGSIGNLKNK